jgi:hypothetical protein
MNSESKHWTAALFGVAWAAFFIALIFRPSLVLDYPILAAVAIGGCAWWMVKAYRTRRREKARLLDTDKH